MRREPVFNCLKGLLENYREERLQVVQYLDEHQEEFSDSYANAVLQRKSLKKNQILFWGGTWKKFSKTITGSLFKLLRKNKKLKNSCIFVARTDSELESLNKKKIPAVLKDSPEHKELLATSSYLIGRGLLPASFIKKDGQICVLFSEECEEKDVDRRSVILKDFLKADLLFADHPDAVQRLYPVLNSLGKKIIDTGHISDTEQLLEIIFNLQQESIPAENGVQPDKKKRILLLTDWKDSRENRQFVRFLADKYTKDGYEVAALSTKLTSDVLKDSFDQLNASVRFLMRGKMTITREEHFLLLLLEKHPELYIRETVIKEFIDEIFQREYRRIWGEDVVFDKIILSGAADARIFFLAAGAAAKEHILVENGFLNIFLNTNNITDDSIRNDCIRVFDHCILLPDNYEAKKLSAELSEKEILVLPETVDYEDAECFRMEDKDYLICDEWPDTLGRLQMRVFQYPQKDSVLINAELAPDKERVRKIRELSNQNKREVFLIGPKAQAYQNFLPKAIILDNYAKRLLAFLPGAPAFFSRFAVYLGEERLEYDVMEEILKPYTEIEKRR